MGCVVQSMDIRGYVVRVLDSPWISVDTMYHGQSMDICGYNGHPWIQCTMDSPWIYPRIQCTLRCLLIASTKFSVLEGACIWLVLILAILQVGCLSEIHVYIRIHTC